MALFTDGTVSTIGDLLGYESAVLEVASTEGIDLGVKLRLAQEEIGVALEAYLARHADMAGLGSPPELDNIVVTRALQKWHTFQALALVFRDAYHRQLNDRHAAKWKEYKELADWASTALFDTGIGLVWDPVPQAAPPELTTTAGALDAATYYVRAAWVSATADEGYPSELAVCAAAAGSVPVASLADPPAGALGWNVYAGLTAERQTLQNASVIPAGSTWRLPDGGLVNGRTPGTGQSPDWYLRNDQLVQRG